jgi:toxin ParE1/3/4
VRIIWSPLALERLTQIADYIIRDNPLAARRLVIAIFKKVQRLSRFPESGRQVPETHRQDIREILHSPYRIIYRLRSSHIAVLTIRHSKQRFSYTEIREIR